MHQLPGALTKCVSRDLVGGGGGVRIQISGDDGGSYCKAKRDTCRQSEDYQ